MDGFQFQRNTFLRSTIIKFVKASGTILHLELKYDDTFGIAIWNSSLQNFSRAFSPNICFYYGFWGGFWGGKCFVFSFQSTTPMGASYFSFRFRYISCFWYENIDEITVDVYNFMPSFVFPFIIIVKNIIWVWFTRMGGKNLTISIR